jgi:hypothetical protein
MKKTRYYVYGGEIMAAENGGEILTVQDQTLQDKYDAK